MDLYSGIDANGNLETTSYGWHHDDQKNALNAQNATNALNVSLAKYQNDWNLQQWQREMEWNSPANQLRLLQEAGLNPNIFGQGLAGNMRTQAPQSADMSVAGDFYQSQEQAKMANVASLLGSLGDQANNIYAQFMQGKQLALASDRLDIDRQEARSRIVQNYAKTSEIRRNTDKLLSDMKVNEATYYNLVQKVAESKHNCDLIDERKRVENLNADFLQKTMNQRVYRESLQNSLMKADIDCSKEMKYKIQADFLHAMSDVQLIGEQTIYQQFTNKIQKFFADNVEVRNLNDTNKSKLLGTLYGWLNEMLEGAANYNPADDYYNDLRNNQSRSTRNPVGAGWTPLDLFKKDRDFYAP